MTVCRVADLDWVVESMSRLSKIKAIIFDFDGTLAVLNIDFSLMRQRVLRLINEFGFGEESIREKYSQRQSGM